MTANTLRKTIMLAAPREQVWDYLTLPEHLAKWFHAPKAPLTEGSVLELFGTESGNKLIWGKVRVARAPEYLEYTFCVNMMGDAESVVKWTLDAVPGGTMLSLVHEGLPEGEAAFSVLMSLDAGWDGHLARMRADLNEIAA
ncbi:ATPase [Sulfitobacter sp. EhC04]|uniref:SRPBCC family protein n=1 Tax=Sulfitobacter sp. EhC04 TaxID=1849168 RepID=UPI0007F3D9E5|nr:SRPBCC domain-containing protein [Sulfitobacter sp. EhC04]OAN78278.1 ATPase [Sulfitobacter sp. EhC04]